MELVTPGIGLLFWMTLSFLSVFFLLKKFAWKPILGMIKEREQSIENALNAAEEAKKEIQSLKSSNDKLLAEARLERDAMLKDAREIREGMINEAKTKAISEGDRIMAAARVSINSEKIAAIAEIKNQVATLSIEIAEKILKTELAGADKQKALVNNLLDEVKLN